MSDSLEKLTILHVEDNPDFRDLFMLMFGEAFSIESASTADKAVSRLSEKSCDAMVVDFDIDGTTGIDLLKTVKDMIPDLPVIFYSGQRNEEVAREAFVSGASDYFTKDISEFAHKDKIINSIRQAVEKNRIRKERRQAREELKKSEKRYRTLLRMIPDIVINIDTAGLITYVNDSVRILGYEPSDLKGFPLARLIQPDDFRELNHLLFGEARMPEYINKTGVFEEDQLPGGYPVRILPRVPAHDTGFLAKSGGLDIFHGEISANPVFEEDGGKDPVLTGRVILIRIITKRRRAQEKLKLLLNAVEQSEEAMVITNAKGRIKYVNPSFEKITGYTRDEALGTDLENIQPVREDPEIYNILLKSAASGNSWSGHIETQKKDGEPYQEEAHIFPLYGYEGSVVGVAKTSRDVTEKCRLEKQFMLAQKMEALSRLASGMAHDFNNLLTGISGNVELAKMSLRPQDPLMEFLDDIAKASWKANYLLKQLMVFGKKQTVTPQPVQINKAIQGMQNTIARMIGEGISLWLDLSPEVRSVSIDPAQLEQIIISLVLNARDAMVSGDRLTIKTGLTLLENVEAVGPMGVKPGRYCTLQIIDTGRGIDEDSMNHIFEPFYTTKKEHRNTGLGLSTVYGIVRQSGGSINVSSQLNRGTVVTLQFPATEPSGTKADTPSSSILSAVGGKETILLVEDDEMVSDIVSQVLTKMGYAVLKTGRGDEAMAIIKKMGRKPDLLITDIMVPGMNGWKLASEFEKIYPDGKVLFMSGYTGDMVSHGYLGKERDFISKPLNMTEFLNKIRTVIDRKEQ